MIAAGSITEALILECEAQATIRAYEAKKVLRSESSKSGVRARTISGLFSTVKVEAA